MTSLNQGFPSATWERERKIPGYEVVGKTAADKVKKLAEVNNFRITTALRPSTHQSLDLFEFRTITPDEVRRIILNSPSNKAPGADRINIQVIKDPIGVILGPGADIINCSLLTSTYPSMWKIARVVALHNCYHVCQKSIYRTSNKSQLIDEAPM